MRTTSPRSRLMLWCGIALAVAGYFGPWVPHKAAGLVQLGYDLAEYVKFLPEVRAGTLPLWREWFILPAASLSLAISLAVWGRRLGLRWYLAVPFLIADALVALTMLPPAWTPALLLTPEFRVQTGMMIWCLGALVLSPLWRFLPDPMTGLVAAVLQMPAAVGAAVAFLRVKPAVDVVYGTPPPIGWGFVAYLVGVALIVVGGSMSVWGEGRTARVGSMR